METSRRNSPALRRLGYTPDLDDRFSGLCAASGLADAQPARVIVESVDRFRLAHQFGESDALARRGPRPAVGDWVVASTADDWATATIDEVMDRTTLLSRRAVGKAEVEQPIAANVDTVFVLMGLDGDYNLRRLERYLVTVADSGAAAVVVLTKADISTDAVGARLDAVSVAAGAPVYIISAHTGSGLDALRPFLEEGVTVALVGSSGAGKSTLVNALAGEEVMATRAVRSSDSHGRHTTTQRRLVSLPGGSLVVDTPGLREIQLWVDEESLGTAFPEIEELAPGCRFRDCTHGAEPGCAVNAAVGEGRIDGDRIAGWRKLRDEVAGAERRRDAAAHREEDRRRGRMYRDAQNLKRRR